MGLIIFIISLILLAAIPVNRFFFWLYSKNQEIRSQLENKNQRIYLSKYPLVYLSAVMFDFLKGFVVPLVTVLYISENPVILLVVTGIVLSAHHWPLFDKCRLQRGGLILLWGIYTFISFQFIWAAPVILILTSLASNSLLLGRLISICLFFPILWFYQFDPIFLPINFLIFLISFIAFSTDVFEHIEARKHTLLRTFERR